MAWRVVSSGLWGFWSVQEFRVKASRSRTYTKFWGIELHQGCAWAGWAMTVLIPQPLELIQQLKKPQGLIPATAHPTARDRSGSGLWGAPWSRSHPRRQASLTYKLDLPVVNHKDLIYICMNVHTCACTHRDHMLFYFYVGKISVYRYM